MADTFPHAKAKYSQLLLILLTYRGMQLDWNSLHFAQESDALLTELSDGIKLSITLI